MRFRFGMLLVLLVALGGCVFAAPSQSGAPVSEATPGSGAPDGARTPRADRTPPPNFTPGAQGTRNAQRAQTPPAANSTPSANTNATTVPTLVAPTAVAVNPITQTTGIAPTAVPIPQIVIPTPLPSTSNAGPTPGGGNPTDNGGNPLPPAATPVAGTNTSGSAPLPAGQPATVSLEALRGKIVFFSDRGGLYPQLYVMNPDGSNPQLCNCSDLLPSLVNTDLASPDGQQVLFVKQTGPARSPDFQIWTHNTQTNQDQALTGGPPGFPGVDYNPTWSPDSRHIAWVTETNGFDEIYVHDRLSNADTRLTQSQGEWYKHPSYSPDGTQLTYWTNLGNLNRKQIWVSGAEGAQPHNISNNPFNDWDPIWVK